jgi:hypothetical protein
MQCAAFLAGMVRSRRVRRAMVLAPKTLLGQWAAELRRCGLGGRVFEYHGNSAADRCRHNRLPRVGGAQSPCSWADRVRTMRWVTTALHRESHC